MGAVSPWAGLIVEFSGLAFLSAVAIAATVLPERWSAQGGVSQPSIAGWFALAVFILSIVPFRRPVFKFNPIFVFLAVVAKRLDHKSGALIASAQIAGAFTGVIIAQYGLNLDPVEAPEFGTVDLRRAIAEGFAGVCLGYLALLNFGGNQIISPFARSLDTEKRESDQSAPTPVQRGSAYNLAVIGGALAISLMSFVFIGFGPGFAFGNPAITLARTLTTDALGISPVDALISAVSPILGAAVAWLISAEARPSSY